MGATAERRKFHPSHFDLDGMQSVMITSLTQVLIESIQRLGVLPRKLILVFTNLSQNVSSSVAAPKVLPLKILLHMGLSL